MAIGNLGTGLKILETVQYTYSAEKFSTYGRPDVVRIPITRYKDAKAIFIQDTYDGNWVTCTVHRIYNGPNEVPTDLGKVSVRICNYFNQKLSGTITLTVLG